MKNNINSKLIILLALVLCLAACDGAVHLPGIINSNDPIVTVSVKYDANGGTGNMDDQIVEQNVATKLSSNSFSRNGYSFDGWNTKSDGTGTSYSNEELATIAEDLILYAMWDGIEYLIDYHFSHNLDVPTIKEYFDNNQVDPSLTGYNNYADYNANSERFDSGSVTYKYKCGEGLILPGAVKDSIYLYTPGVLDQKNYAFDGWYLDINDENSKVYEISSTDYGDKVLYAKFKNDYGGK